MADDRPVSTFEGEASVQAFPGKGAAFYAARLLELRRMQKEAALADNWKRVDQIESQIRQTQSSYADAKAKGI